PGGGVEQHRDLVVGCLVEPVEHDALVVGLAHLDVEVERGSPGDTLLDQLVVGGVAVDLRLTATEPPEIGAVEHPHLRRHHAPPVKWSYAARSDSSDGPANTFGSARPWSTTKRNWEPRAFLSTAMVARSSSNPAPAHDVGRPTIPKVAACRAARASSMSPSRRASSATYVQPSATASRSEEHTSE